jgi:hypothetical protein
MLGYLGAISGMCLFCSSWGQPGVFEDAGHRFDGLGVPLLVGVVAAGAQVQDVPNPVAGPLAIPDVAQRYALE